MKASEWSQEHYLKILITTPYLNPEELREGLKDLALRLNDTADALVKIEQMETETWLT